MTDFLHRLKKRFSEHKKASTQGQQQTEFFVDKNLSLHYIDYRLKKGGITIFTDAAFVDGRTYLVGVARDASRLLQARYKRYFADSPCQAEAKALLLAISRALDNGQNKLLFLSDSLLLADSVKSSDDLLICRCW